MPKITTHLWFDKEAKQAADLYKSVFENSKFLNQTKIHNTPSGAVDIINMEIMGNEFQLINAGPYFQFSPAISFLVTQKTKDGVVSKWNSLAKNGKTLMDLNEYPFSEKYGWVQDEFGLSWQLLYSKDPSAKEKITPSVMFAGDVCGMAEEAINHYISIFPKSRIINIERYEENEEPDKAGTIKHATFSLLDVEFAIMDSARTHDFNFNESISFMVHCDTQKEIDFFWEKLSAVKEAEQCGWLRDKYGLSWQIVPTAMEKMMQDKDRSKIARLTEAFLKMKKFDIDTLEKAYNGKLNAG